ncbi:uncharacterized protein LOC110863926 [Helianthus annuus]|uniref:uncharacterized protein LOC110863926 n=1 Tax=Helianthus annuus TaxID=4232 RepID=UPI000B8F3A77|nr:uncharacterized protein LOC110863926 [Helianthus annuus]
MGNCIIIQNKIMQKGEEVIKHRGSMKVNQVLGGQTYDPLPLSEKEGVDRVVRIKLVITKQELEVMLRKGGVSAGDLASRMQKESSDEAVVIEEDSRSCGRWKPVLDSIPESN